MKTLKLIEHYKSLLEQDEVEQVEEVDVDVEVKEDPPAPGEQAMAELIAAAFAYLPTDDDADAIEEIELFLVGTQNKAPGVSDIKPRSVIKNVIARLPVQLRAVYTRGPGVGNLGITPESEIYLAQTLADAFRYRRTNQDALIASTTTDEYGADAKEPDPMKVIETIQRLLQFSDEPVEQELETVDAH
tara:strand:- start:4475 stop:5038 length:564 start_codon:yes stop_codon:yes gene_type:complete